MNAAYRDPTGDHTARFIAAAEFKGAREGGALVSDKHASAIISTGNAGVRDISRRIERVQSEVERTFGVRLIPEVRRVGG